MTQPTRTSTHMRSLLLIAILLLNQSCSSAIAPIQQKSQNNQSQVNPENPSQPPNSPTEPPAEPPLVDSPLWKMESPVNGIVSSDFTPKIVGLGFTKQNGQTAVAYTDAACTKEVGRAPITDGQFHIRPVFDEAGSQDGAIRFYGKILARDGKGLCSDLSLGYTLNTKTPVAQGNYFRMMLKDDPATTAVIGFNASSTNLNDHRLYYDTEDHGRDTDAYRYSANPSAIEVFNQMNNAFVRLQGLKPDTAYYFVIADSKGVSRRLWFKTAPTAPDTKLSIVAGGDSRNNRVPRQNANLLVAKLRPHFIMFGGDMTGGGSAAEWREWFEDWQLTIASDGRIFPVLVARGNHESSNAMIEKFFDTPTGVYYAVSFVNDLLRVYTLNTESGISGAQTTWLGDDLSKNTKSIWKFAQYHKPMRPHVSGKAEGTSQYNAWAALFHKYNMNLVSESDAHTVKSTWPLRPSTSSGNSEGFVRDDKEGTVYIGEGGWGAPLRTNNDLKSWTRDSGRFNHINWIVLDRERVDVRFIKTDNANQVASLDEQSLFEVPPGLDIWNPKNGSVITLTTKAIAAGILADSSSNEETHAE